MSNSFSARLGFVFTLLYVIVEYSRPQDRIALLGAIRLPLILISILVALLSINWHRLRMVASPQTTRMLLILFLLALHTLFAANIGRAYLAIQGMFEYLIIFISIIVFVDTPNRLRVFYQCWILLMVYIAVNGILGGGAAGSSFLKDENDFALLMNTMLPFGIFLFFYESNKKIKLFYLIASLLCIASIIASFSRGGFVGLLVVAFAVWLTRPRKILMLGVAGGMALVILNLPITHTGTLVEGSTYWEEMTTITGAEDPNKTGRVEMWKSAWAMFKDHPFGVGPQNFPVLIPDYHTDWFEARNVSPEQLWGKVAHSIWFTLLPEWGIAGVLLYLSLLLANVRDIRILKNLLSDGRSIHRYAYFLSLAFATSIAGYFASGTFLSVLYYPHYWYLTAMIVATRKVVDGCLSTPTEASAS